MGAVTMERKSSTINSSLWEGIKHGDLLKPLWVKIALLCIALYFGLTFDGEATYWPSMLTSYTAASLFLLWQARKNHEATSLKTLKQEMFPKNIWLHPSTLQDLVMTLLTFIVFLHILPNLFLPQSGTMVSSILILQSLGIDQSSNSPAFFAIALYVVLAIAVSDLFYYVSHRLTHEIPILWEFHKVHHSAEVLTPLTVYRIHPLDLWFNQSFRNIGAGIVSGIFFYLYPHSSSLLIIASTHTGLILTHLALANLRHSHIWISFGPTLEHVLISPAQHQIHHSTTPKHFNKNYGSLLSLWDWAFGSLYIPQEKETISFGLGKAKDADVYRSTWKMLVTPIIKFMNFLIK